MSETNFNLSSYINDASSNRFVHKKWDEMSKEEKNFLQVMLRGSNIDAEDFIESDDFYKYDELTYSNMNVYVFQPYFDDFEKIHTMPAELKAMITYGGNSDEFVRMNDDEKRKYLRSLCLNIDDYYEYFIDKGRIAISQEVIDTQQDRIDYRIEEYENTIDEYESQLEFAENQISELERISERLSSENSRLMSDIDHKETAINVLNANFEKIIRELFEEKLKYLLLLSKEMQNVLSIQIVNASFSSDCFTEEDVKSALTFFDRHGIKIVDVPKRQKQNKAYNGDYSKSKAYRDAIKAAESNPFEYMDDWQKRF